MELWETLLGVYDVRRRQLTSPTISQLSQEDLGRGGAHEVNKIEQPAQRSVGVEPFAPALLMVRRRFVAPVLLPLLTTCSM